MIDYQQIAIAAPDAVMQPFQLSPEDW